MLKCNNNKKVIVTLIGHQLPINYELDNNMCVIIQIIIFWFDFGSRHYSNKNVLYEIRVHVDLTM